MSMITIFIKKNSVRQELNNLREALVQQWDQTQANLMKIKLSHYPKTNYLPSYQALCITHKTTEKK